MLTFDVVFLSRKWWCFARNRAGWSGKKGHNLEMEQIKWNWMAEPIDYVTGSTSQTSERVVDWMTSRRNLTESRTSIMLFWCHLWSATSWAVQSNIDIISKPLFPDHFFSLANTRGVKRARCQKRTQIYVGFLTLSVIVEIKWYKIKFSSALFIHVALLINQSLIVFLLITTPHRHNPFLQNSFETNKHPRV